MGAGRLHGARELLEQTGPAQQAGFEGPYRQEG